MALQVQFGNGSTSTTLDLVNPNIDASLALSASTSEVTSGAGSTIPTDSIPVAKVVVPGVGTGSGGSVGVGYDSVNSAFTFDVTGAWNSVKNVLATSADAENIVLKDFVNANVILGGTGNSYVELTNLKRGVIETGSGNDTIKISLLSNDSGWVNSFDVHSGAGNDTITFSAGSAAGQGAIVAGSTTRTDGSYSTAVIDAGAGNDVIDLRGTNIRQATITGGQGNDTFYGGAGKEVYTYGDVAGGSGTDTIYGFNAAIDKIDIAGDFSNVQQLAFGGNLLVLIGQGADATTVILQGQTTLLTSDVFI